MGIYYTLIDQFRFHKRQILFKIICEVVPCHRLVFIQKDHICGFRKFLKNSLKIRYKTYQLIIDFKFFYYLKYPLWNTSSCQRVSKQIPWLYQCRFYYNVHNLTFFCTYVFAYMNPMTLQLNCLDLSLMLPFS